MYSLYVLIKDNRPVYVGVTKSLRTRINSHKKTKDFTHYHVIKEYDNAKDAHIAENSIIRFISLFPVESMVNAIDLSLNCRSQLNAWRSI